MTRNPSSFKSFSTCSCTVEHAPHTVYTGSLYKCTETSISFSLLLQLSHMHVFYVNILQPLLSLGNPLGEESSGFVYSNLTLKFSTSFYLLTSPLLQRHFQNSSCEFLIIIMHYQCNVRKLNMFFSAAF